MWNILQALALTVIAWFTPQSWIIWIIRPFLTWLGFGPAGPVAGSIAAWLQSYFFGGAVAGGSWFAILQAAGMGVIPVWLGLIVKIPLALVGGLLATVFGFFGV